MERLTRLLVPTPDSHRAPGPLRGSVVGVIVRCLGWGAVIGAAAGAVVGAYFIVIGAIYGLPIGFAVGVVVALPATPFVVVRCHRSPNEEVCRHDLAEVFAVVLLLLLTIPAVTAGHILLFAGRGGDGGHPAASLLVVLLTVPPAATVVGLLRSANRSITAAWWDGR